MPDRPGRALETTNPLVRSTGLGPARGVGAILGVNGITAISVDQI